MKPKQSDVLTVSLIVLAVLAPALITLGVVWNEHLQFSAQLRSGLFSAEDLQAGRAAIASLERFANYLAKGTMLATMSLFLGMPIYNGYRAYRTLIFKQKVTELERLWQQSIQQ